MVTYKMAPINLVFFSHQFPEGFSHMSLLVVRSQSVCTDLMYGDCSPSLQYGDRKRRREQMNRLMAELSMTWQLKLPEWLV